MSFAIRVSKLLMIPEQMQDLEQNWSEPVHEYSQFASIIKKLLVYRHQKHVQYEMTQDSLESKKEQLKDLEKSEREANRLEEALGKGRLQRRNSDPGESPRGESERQGDPGNQQEPSMSAVLPPHPGPSNIRRRAPGMGFLSALSYTLHGMMDADPETARRNSISRNRESISQVGENNIYD
jgi:sorting nexin-4